MVVGFTTTYAVSAYHHRCCEFETQPLNGVMIRKFYINQYNKWNVNCCIDNGISVKMDIIKRIICLLNRSSVLLRLWSNGSWIYSYLCSQCLSPQMLWVRNTIRVRCTTLCDKVCQWLMVGLWFSPGTPFFYTNKTNLKISVCYSIHSIYDNRGMIFGFMVYNTTFNNISIILWHFLLYENE
jgi:hypothetical protein